MIAAGAGCLPPILARRRRYAIRLPPPTSSAIATADRDRPRPLAGRERLQRRALTAALRCSELGLDGAGGRGACERGSVATGARPRARGSAAPTGFRRRPALAATLSQRAPPSAGHRRPALAARRAALGVGGLGQRAHDRDPRARRPRATAPTLPVVDPADREERDGRVRAPRSARARGRPPAGPAWSASRARGRRRCSRRRRAGRVDLVGRVRREPDEPLVADELAGPRDRQVVLADVDPVGAGAARTRSGRSLRMNSAPCARAGGREPPRRGEDRLVGAVLHPQLDDVDAAAQRRLEERVRPLVADQVQAGAARSRCRRSSTTTSLAGVRALGLRATGALPAG